MKNDPLKLLTPTFRAAFCQLLEPKAFEGGKPKYSVVMLFNKSDIKKLIDFEKALLTAAREKFGDKLPAGLQAHMSTKINGLSVAMAGNRAWPIKDGDQQAYDGFADQISISASSYDRPGIVDGSLQTVIDPIEVYSGRYMRATIRAYAYDNPANKGVAFGLQNIQLLGHGERFSGRNKPEDDFEAAEDF